MNRSDGQLYILRVVPSIAGALIMLISQSKFQYIAKFNHVNYFGSSELIWTEALVRSLAVSEQKVPEPL